MYPFNNSFNTPSVELLIAACIKGWQILLANNGLKKSVRSLDIASKCGGVGVFILNWGGLCYITKTPKNISIL